MERGPGRLTYCPFSARRARRRASKMDFDGKGCFCLFLSAPGWVELLSALVWIGFLAAANLSGVLYPGLGTVSAGDVASAAASAAAAGGDAGP